MTEPTYDPATCVTAAELRALGLPLPAEIPDCGWIPRGAMRMEQGAVSPVHDPAEVAQGILRFAFQCVFTQPFRWVTLNVVITKP